MDRMPSHTEGDDVMRKRQDKDLAKAPDPARERALEARRPRDLFQETDRWFSDLRTEFDRKFWGSLAPLDEPELALTRPLVDLVDTGREYVLKADLPGVAKEDLELRVTPDGIELAAETRSEREENGKEYAYRERSVRSFRRSLALPDEVLADEAKATLKDGLLEVRLPKKAPMRKHGPVKVRVE